MLKRYWKEIIIGFATGILNGLFGAGGGSVVVPAMEKFLEIDEKQSHATAILVILMMSVVSAFIYVRQGFFDLRLWMWVSIGGVIGGFVGAKLLKRIPKRWLKIGFGAVIVVTAVKMIF
ncbi:MAG: sulfite exporter TauE/SafE family protein [Clostridia bacterium]|nr:sulfite exporter TauE/SafE family protein [Clostridia bacterium]MBR6523948.1 sulfite exporter TauE/SafE family protein [Clostridia bacterium]